MDRAQTKKGFYIFTTDHALCDARITDMMKIVKYGLNGVLRTALPLAGISLSAGMTKYHFEILSLGRLKLRNLDASAQEIHDTTGIVNKYFLEKECKIDTENLQTSLSEPDTIACVKQNFQGMPEVSASIILAPAMLVGLTSAKYLPKGLAYLNITFREAVKSKDRVLTDRDFKKFRHTTPSEAPKLDTLK